MISNERSWPHLKKVQRPSYPNKFGSDMRPPRPAVQEDLVKSTTLQVERKSIMLALKENPRGRLLRITEEAGGRFNSIIIPASGLEEFYKAVGEIVKAHLDEHPEGHPDPTA